jgi:hypothetical protein
MSTPRLAFLSSFFATWKKIKTSNDLVQKICPGFGGKSKKSLSIDEIVLYVPFDRSVENKGCWQKGKAT